MIDKSSDTYELAIYEALYIIAYCPSINQQIEFFIRQISLFLAAPVNETINIKINKFHNTTPQLQYIIRYNYIIIITIIEQAPNNNIYYFNFTEKRF